MNRNSRAEILSNGPMHYAPTNEMGVVFIFSHLAHRLGVRIEQIGSSFPDCIAYQKSGGRESRVRIEFEYKSANFRAHRHSARKCDWIVCWEHDWPGVPQRIHVVELRKFFGLGLNIWIQPVIRAQWPNLKRSRMSWALSKRAHPGDLLLMYRCFPDKRIQDIFILRGDLYAAKAGWRSGRCYGGNIARLCTLQSPIFLEDLRLHPVLKTSSFVRSNMQGNLQVTEYWPYLYQMLTARNRGCSRKLQAFAPGRTLRK